MGKEHISADWLRASGVRSVAANLRDIEITLVRVAFPQISCRFQHLQNYHVEQHHRKYATLNNTRIYACGGLFRDHVTSCGFVKYHLTGRYRQI
jgi:hypothetical protein